MALGIIIPVLPKLVEAGRRQHTRAPPRSTALFGTVWALMQFVFSPILGALSDRYGRRPVLLVSMTWGWGSTYILMALAPDAGLAVRRPGDLRHHRGEHLHRQRLHRRRHAAREARRRSAWSGAAFGIGFVLGPALGGLLGEIDPRLPFWVAAAFAWSTPPMASSCCRSRCPPSGACLPPGGAPTRSARSPARAASPAAGPGRRGVPLSPRPCRAAGGDGALRQLPLRLGRQTMGLTLAAVGVASGVVQGGLIRPTIRRLGERPTLIGRTAVRGGRLRDLRPGRHRRRLLGRHSGDGAVGPRPAPRPWAS